MFKYKRLKSIDGSGTIMRYYDLAEGQLAGENLFYEVVNDKAVELEEGTEPTGNVIGFSHGGDALVRGKILLDINPSVVYRIWVEEGEEKPAIGDVVDGYKLVIATHYDNSLVVDSEFDKFTIDNLVVAGEDKEYYLAIIKKA